MKGQLKRVTFKKDIQRTVRCQPLKQTTHYDVGIMKYHSACC